MHYKESQEICIKAKKVHSRLLLLIQGNKFIFFSPKCFTVYINICVTFSFMQLLLYTFNYSQLHSITL